MTDLKYPNTKARHRILYLLKTSGPQESRKLAQTLGVSAMAVRQHLYAFQNEGLVSYVQEPRPKGRPVKMWKLTDEADSFFPDQHKQLLRSILEQLREERGSKFVRALLEGSEVNACQAYTPEIESKKTFPGKLKTLARLRTRDGYMARIEKIDQGTYEFIQSHCPIKEAASCHGKYPAFEESLIQQILGKDYTVTGKEHILNGDSQSTFEIKR